MRLALSPSNYMSSTLDLSDKIWIGMTVTFHTLAISMGSFRLIHRYRTKLFYWDDWGVAGCLVCNIIIFCMLCSLKGESPIEYRQKNEQPWLLLFWICLSSAQWTSRLSIAFTVLQLLRLILFDVWRKRLIIVLVVAFTLAWMLITLDFTIECHVNALPHADCTRQTVTIVSYAVYIIADAGLVYIPLHLLRHLRQPRGSRLMIRVVFSAAGISTAATLANLITDIYEEQTETVRQLASILKAPITLIACSLIVVIPCVYRLFKKDEEEWVVSIPINIDVSDAVPAAPSAVALPERVAVRDPAIRSFPTFPLPFLNRSLVERGQLHSWPQRDCIEDKSAMLETDV
ncbi:hypothetical protein JOM56_007159 [Amanita muscaria]